MEEPDNKWVFFCHDLPLHSVLERLDFGLNQGAIHRRGIRARLSTLGTTKRQE